MSRGIGDDDDEPMVDHYEVLGLPSGEDGFKLTVEEILRAYRQQSLLRHPDKRPDDPNATADFQILKASFEALRDPATRARFDARLRIRIRFAHDAKRKRQRLVTELEERERAAAAERRANKKKNVKDFNRLCARRDNKKICSYVDPYSRTEKCPTERLFRAISRALRREIGWPVGQILI